MITPRALIDGRSTPLGHATLAITDPGVSRGDGAFETVGVWGGHPFRLDDHMVRLDRSLVAIGLPPAPSDAIRADVATALDGQTADGALRVYVTAAGTRIVSLSPPPDRPALRRLVTQTAPWIRPVGTYGPAAAKTMSYGPNMAAARAAQRAGGDDALLVSLEGHVLEGPTFTILWVRDGVLCAPDLTLGLVDSISRRTILDLASAMDVDVVTGRWGRDDLGHADEVMACSSVRPLQAIAAIDGDAFATTAPMTTALAERLAARRAGGAATLTRHAPRP